MWSTFSPALSRAQLLERVASTAPAAPLPAPATNPAAVDAEIDDLLAQLASDDWPARDAAQDRLAALAERAVARLERAARESNDAEVRTRCEAALQQIAENRLIGPTLITMRVHNVHPRVAFDELARQVGAELKQQNKSLWNAQLRAVTLNVQREPFWDVVRRLHEQCGLDLEPWQTGLVIVQTGPRGGGGGKAPAVTHGPFRIRATRVSRSYAVDLASGRGVINDFHVMLAFQAEPKLKISSGSPNVTLELAEDENGLSLLPGDVEGGADPLADRAAAAIRPRAMLTEVSLRGGSGGWTATAPLAYPPSGAGQRIARLKGAAACNVVVRVDAIEVNDILTVDNLTKEIGGTTVTIRSCRRVDGSFELVLTMPGAAADGPAAARVLRAPGQANIRLLDADGRDMTSQGTSTSSSNGRIEIKLRYAAAAAGPAKLLWHVPTEVREMEIPFEFTDLPLP